MALVTISLIVGLVLIQYGHGQDANNSTEEAELLLGNQNVDNATQKQREALLNYCFEHADRPNPIQDLVDKGFLSEDFKETCKSVKEKYDRIQAGMEYNLRQGCIKDLERRGYEATETMVDRCVKIALLIAETNE